MMRLFIFTVLLYFIFPAQSYAVTRNWDGGGDQQSWTNPMNWDCNCLPGADDYAVLFTVDSVVIPAAAVVHVDEILFYNDFTIGSGAILTVDNKIRSLFNGVFINIGTINISGEGLYINDSKIIHNQGTINFSGTIGASIILSASGMDSISFVNNGLLKWNNTPSAFFQKSGKTGFINQSTGSIVFDLESNYINNLGGTFQNYGNIGNKGRIINSGIFTNHPMADINIVNSNSAGIINNGTFDNSGFVNISNGGIQYGIENNWVWSASGSIEINAKNIAYNTHEMHLDGPVMFNADIAYNGLVNNGDLFFGGTDYNAQLNCRWMNMAGKIMTIEACKSVIHQGPFDNQGELYNYGTYSLTYNEVPTLGVFSNGGIFYSNIDIVVFPPPTMPDPSVNYGIHIKKIEGHHCVGSPINDIFTGSLINISQSTSGIFTDAALTISAGTLDFTNKIFTPNTACHNLDTLYLSAKRTACPDEVFTLLFAEPIYAPKTYFADVDFDGFGDADSTILVACGPIPFGFVVSNTDCDDAKPDVYPGAPELCSDKDYNCDGMLTGTNPAPTWYKDEDSDGYGNSALSIINCNPVTGYVGNDDDCDDNDAFINPTSMEACNNIDDDCDGSIDEDFPATTAIFNGSVSTSWFDPMNWTPAMVPGICIDVIIPPGEIVQIASPPLVSNCRSLSIGKQSIVTVVNALNIEGGTSFGIYNLGLLNFSNDAYINIQNINGNGVVNDSIINMVGNATLYVSGTTHHSIRNLAGSTFIINNGNRLDMNDADSSAIYNSGVIIRDGSFNANNIAGSVIRNEGAFINEGNLFANAFGLADWFIDNRSGGTFTNNASRELSFPIPNSFYNVSNKGLINHPGSTFHNYGTLRFFGHRIAGSGMFINHAGSMIEGCDPMMGCP